METKKLSIDIPAEHFDEFINTVAEGLGWTEKKLTRSPQGQPVLSNQPNKISKPDWVQNWLEAELRKAYEKGVTVRLMRDARVRASNESMDKLTKIFNMGTPE